MNTNIMDSPITSLKPGRTLSMTHERHGRACDGRDLSVKFNLAEKVKSDPQSLRNRGGGKVSLLQFKLREPKLPEIYMK